MASCSHDISSDTSQLSYCREEGCSCPIYEAPSSSSTIGTRCDLCEHEIYWHHKPVSLTAEEICRVMDSKGWAVEMCKSKECTCPIWVGDNGVIGGGGNNCFLCGHKMGWHKASVDKAKERERERDQAASPPPLPSSPPAHPTLPSFPPPNIPLPSIPSMKSSNTPLPLRRLPNPGSGAANLNAPAATSTSSSGGSGQTRSLLSENTQRHTSSSTTSSSRPSSPPVTAPFRSLPMEPPLIGYPSSSSGSSYAASISDASSIWTSTTTASIYHDPPLSAHTIPIILPSLIGYPQSSSAATINSTRSSNSSGSSMSMSQYSTSLSQQLESPPFIGYPPSLLSESSEESRSNLSQTSGETATNLTDVYRNHPALHTSNSTHSDESSNSTADTFGMVQHRFNQPYPRQGNLRQEIFLDDHFLPPSTESHENVDFYQEEYYHYESEEEDFADDHRHRRPYHPHSRHAPPQYSTEYSTESNISHATGPSGSDSQLGNHVEPQPEVVGGGARIKRAKKVRRAWSTHRNTRVHIQCSPPLRKIPVGLGDKIECRVKIIGPRLSLSNYKKLEVVFVGTATVSGEPPQHHEFVTVLKSILPRTADVQATGLEDKEWMFSFEIPSTITCSCQGVLHITPPTFLHDDVQVRYRLELRGERKELLKVKDRMIIPVTIRRPVDSVDPLIRLHIQDAIGHDGSWTYSRLSARVKVPIKIAVKDQIEPINDAEIAYEIYSANPLLIHYRFSLAFPPSTVPNSVAMSRLRTKLRIALSRRIVLKDLTTGKETLRPSLRVKSLVQRTDDDLIGGPNRVVWRVEGRVVVQEENICVWRTCNAEVRFFLSCHIVDPTTLSREIGLLVPIKDFVPRQTESDLQRYLNDTETTFTDYTDEWESRYTFTQDPAEEDHHSLREWEESGYRNPLQLPIPHP